MSISVLQFHAIAVAATIAATTTSTAITASTTNTTPTTITTPTTNDNNKKNNTMTMMVMMMMTSFFFLAAKLSNKQSFSKEQICSDSSHKIKHVFFPSCSILVTNQPVLTLTNVLGQQS